MQSPVRKKNPAFIGMRTVKASNFAPHQNFGPILARSVASLGQLCTKNEQNKAFKSKVFYFLHFSVDDSMLF
jgi:hypothetical protein